MLNRQEIDKIIQLCAVSENSEEAKDITFLRTLLRGKILIDRWDTGTVDTILIHKNHQEELTKELSSNQFYDEEKNVFPTIWGAAIHFLDDMPYNKIVMLALDAQYEDKTNYCDYFVQLNEGALIASTNIAVFSI